MDISLAHSFFKRYYSVALLILLLNSCRDFSFHDGINHGKIEYLIEYPDIPKDSYILDLMPKKMETIFSEGNYRNNIIAGMGLFKTSIICLSDNDKLIHSVKILTTKYVSEVTSEEIENLNPALQNISIEFLEDKKEIAGYHCKSARVNIDTDSSWSFILYYTDEINIPNVNSHTPFKEIEGVLMEYEIISYNTHMRFKAEKVVQEEIKMEEILLEEGYKAVSPEKLKNEIETIFNKVK